MTDDIGLLYEPDAPDVRCQRSDCDYQLRRDDRGHLMHVTHEGHYIYIDHKPVPPQPKETHDRDRGD